MIPRAATIVALAIAGGAFAPDPIADGFRAFWAAASPRDADKAAQRLIRDHVEFDTAWARLKKGRPYGKAPTGHRIERLAVDGTSFENTIDIPDDYDPARTWTLRVQLHGGIGRPEPQEPQRQRQNRIAGEDQIYVLPQGWADAAWWHANQVDNILTLLDRVKRSYNVDESHVYVTGISDGATGVYYLAMREPTPWSACLPLNGNIGVLANRAVGADGELFAGNLVNRPFFIVNGGRDPLYPAESIAPSIELMKRTGVPLVFRPQPTAGHDTSWWPSERPAYEQFVREHPRQPHAPQLSWETERTDRYNRIQWLVIDELGAASSDLVFDEVRFFDHSRRSGRVDAVRRGNTIEARTRGVRAFVLLLSPDAIDFSSPVTMTVNGRAAFQGRVANDVATLLKWAARDNDRTMLFGAELKIRVP